MSLLSSSGATVYTQNADSLGGLLFRNVTPGSGYRVRLASTGETSGPITVHSDAAAPWDPSIYEPVDPRQRLHVSDDAGRHPAGDRRPPADQSGRRARRAVGISLSDLPAAGCADAELHTAVSDADRVLGLRVREPGRPGKRHRGARQPDGLRGGRRQHARDRLLGRRLRLLRTAAEPRWLRRDRDDRPPAVGARPQGRACSASPTARSASSSRRRREPPDLEAIAPLSTIDATATTLYPGGILNTGFAVAWAEQRQQNAEPAGPGTARHGHTKRIEEGDQDLRSQPGPPRRGGQPADRRSRKTRPTTRRWPTRSTRSRSSTKSTCRRSWRASGRTSRPAATAPIWPSTSPARSASGSRSPTAPISTRSIRTRTTGCTTSWSSTSRTRRRSTTRRSCDAAAPVVYQEAMGLPEGDLVTLPPDPIQEAADLRSGAGGIRRAPGDPGAVRQRRGRPRRPAARRPAIRTRASNSRSPSSRSPARTLAPGISGLTARSPNSRDRQGVDSYTSNANALPLTDYSTNTGSGGLWSDASQWEWNWEQNPAGSAVSYVSAPLTSDTTAIGGGRRPPVGRSHPLRTSTSRRRSARCVPTATRRSSRTAGSAASERKLATSSNNMFKQKPDAARSRSRRSSRPMWNRCPRTNSSRSSSRCTSRGTCTARARASGSRSPRPTEHSRSGRSARQAGRHHRDGGDRLLARAAVEPRSSRSCRASAFPRGCLRARACATSPAAPSRHS